MMFDTKQFVRTVGETNARLVLNTTLKNIDAMMSHLHDLEIFTHHIKAYELYFKTIDGLNKSIAAGVNQSKSENKDPNQPDFEAADDWNKKREQP